MCIQRTASGYLTILATFLLCLFASLPVSSQEHEQDLDFAQVRYVTATQERGGTWRFDVTVEHNDTGWDHYADAWEVVDHETNEVLAERVLLHPHVNEMPFTRSEAGVEVPDGVSLVRIRAKCNVHGFGGYEVVVDLSADDGDRFTVDR